MVAIRDSRISKKCGMVMVIDDYTVKNTIESSKNTVLEKIRSWQNKRPSAQNLQFRAQNYTVQDLSKKYRLKIHDLYLLSVNLEKNKTRYFLSVIFEKNSRNIKKRFLRTEPASFLKKQLFS